MHVLSITEVRRAVLLPSPMILRSLVIVAMVCLLCGCRARPVVPDDGLAGQTFRGVRFSCPELWIGKNGTLAGTLTIENTTDEPIRVDGVELSFAFLDMRSRTGTPSGEPLHDPDPLTIRDYFRDWIEVPPQASVEHPWMAPLPMSQEWRSHDGPIPVRVASMVRLHGKEWWTNIPLIVDSTVRRR